jgi:DNA-binding FadR family transcriptional regulator
VFIGEQQIDHYQSEFIGLIVEWLNMVKVFSSGHSIVADAQHPRFARGPSIEVAARVRAFIREHGYTTGDRLPPERELAQKVGSSRAHLREALASLVSTGEIWRHVGKGTFISSLEPSDDSNSINQIARLTTPMEVMEARLLVEPKLAALAAVNATEIDIALIEGCLKRGTEATDIMVSQRLGDDLHRAIARAAKNNLLLSLFETVYAVREATNWGRLKPALQTVDDLTRQWEQHRAFVTAVRERDAPTAERLMRQHIEYIRQEMQNIAAGNAGGT